MVFITPETACPKKAERRHAEPLVMMSIQHVSSAAEATHVDPAGNKEDARKSRPSKLVLVMIAAAFFLIRICSSDRVCKKKSKVTLRKWLG